MIQIKGNRIVLREFVSTDIDPLYYWVHEDSVQEAKKWNAPYIPRVHRTKEKFLSQWYDTVNLLPRLPDSLVILTDDIVIGAVNAYWVDENTQWLETGIVIYNPEYWGGGYGSEVYKLWIDYIFDATDIHRIGMSTWSGNVRMMKTAAKLGMKEEARIREARVVDGVRYDAIKMGMLRHEWEKCRTLNS